MKQSTIIWIAVIVLIFTHFCTWLWGYTVHTCQKPTYIDSPIYKPKPDSANLALIERLTHERDSLKNIKPKQIIHEKLIYYHNLNKHSLCDSVTKHFGTGFDML